MKNALTKKLLALGVSSTIAISGGYLVGQWEGKENTAYKDMVGVVTACYGQTKGVKMGDVFTDEECEKDLASELSKYNIGMKRYVKVDLSPQEEIAYTSFVWNVGLGAWNSALYLRNSMLVIEKELVKASLIGIELHSLLKQLKCKSRMVSNVL